MQVVVLLTTAAVASLHASLIECAPTDSLLKSSIGRKQDPVQVFQPGLDMVKRGEESGIESKLSLSQWQNLHHHRRAGYTPIREEEGRMMRRQMKNPMMAMEGKGGHQGKRKKHKKHHGHRGRGKKHHGHRGHGKSSRKKQQQQKAAEGAGGAEGKEGAGAGSGAMAEAGLGGGAGKPDSTTGAPPMEQMSEAPPSGTLGGKSKKSKSSTGTPSKTAAPEEALPQEGGATGESMPPEEAAGPAQ